MTGARTFADLLGRLHDEQFVGRDLELSQFEQWLAEPGGAPILVVSGGAGMGKSWLLEAFAGSAAAARRRVVRVEATAGLPAGPADLVLVDHVEALGPGAAAFAASLEQLPGDARIVLAGRHPLREGPWRRWEPLMRRMELGRLERDDQLRYLDRRGVDDERLRAEVLLRCGGHPLTMALAVDLIVDQGGGDFTTSTGWRSAVRLSVDQLLGEAGEPMAEALQVAAVLGAFDRASLRSVLGAEAGDPAFVRLCSLSATRVRGGQLTLHDDVRRAVVEDLRLHDPDRLDAIRRRAIRHYRHAAAARGGEEATRLSIERLFLLSRDVMGLSSAFEGEEGATVQTAVPSDLPELLDLLDRSPVHPGVPAAEHDHDRMAAVLADPDTTVSVARDDTGALLGFAWYLRMTGRTRTLFAGDEEMGRLLDVVAAASGPGGDHLPDVSNTYYLSTIVTVSGDPSPNVLLRGVLGLLLGEGVYVCAPGRVEYAELCASLLMAPLPEVRVGDRAPVRAWLADLSRWGYEGWIQLLLRGRPEPGLPDEPELARLVADALSHLDDDEHLLGTPLALVAAPDEELPVAERAQAVRELLERSAVAAGPWPTPELRIRRAMAAAGRTDVRHELPGLAPVGPLPTSPSGGETGAPVAAPAAVRLLGGFEVRVDGRRMTVPGGAVSTVVKVVALRRVVLVDEIIELLWPDAEPAAGRPRLRTVLARIRHAVGPELIVRRGDEISLGEGVVVDATRFDELAGAALSSGDEPGLVAALDGYRGELLPADRYEDWTAVPRERLTRTALEVLDRLADRAEEAGDADRAARFLERAIEADPYEEDRYLRAAGLRLAQGRRAAALTLVQRAEAAAASLGVEPTAATRRVRDRLLMARGEPSEVESLH
jgi:DNA-binding SARP family transcriptional activator